MTILSLIETVKGAMAVLGTNWDQTWHVVKRAVERGRARKQAVPLKQVGIDEKAFRKGQSYLTLLYDLQRSTVEAISEGNDTESGKACFAELSGEQIDSIEAIAMDMSAAYVRAARESVPDADDKIVHDRFHVMKLATEAVDKVRKGEHRKLNAEGDKRLAGTKYVWIKSQENLTDRQREVLAAAYKAELNTGKAWAYKEMLRDLWHHDDAEAATGFFRDWYRRVIHTRLDPLKQAAKAIKKRLAHVVSYCTHRITNAVAEGMNSKIMSIKRRVGGYRNVEHFKTAIFFHCGGLDLLPTGPR